MYNNLFRTLTPKSAYYLGLMASRANVTEDGVVKGRESMDKHFVI